MTYLSARIACLALLAALAAAGCDSPGVCPCPAGVATVTLPVTESVSIASVSSVPPCSASDLPDGHVLVARAENGSCQVTAQLTNGDRYEFAVEFRASGNGCCGHTAYPVESTAPHLVDAGS